jgi:hypothetical protein
MGSSLRFNAQIEVGFKFEGQVEVEAQFPVYAAFEVSVPLQVVDFLFSRDVLN